jgi:hypothetical protein
VNSPCRGPDRSRHREFTGRPSVVLDEAHDPFDNARSTRAKGPRHPSSRRVVVSACLHPGQWGQDATRRESPGFLSFGRITARRVWSGRGGLVQHHPASVIRRTVAGVVVGWRVCASPCLCIAGFVRRRVCASPCLCVAVFVRRRVCASLCLCVAVFVRRCVCASPCLCIAAFVRRRGRSSPFVDKSRATHLPGEGPRPNPRRRRRRRG